MPTLRPDKTTSSLEFTASDKDEGSLMIISQASSEASQLGQQTVTNDHDLKLETLQD